MTDSSDIPSDPVVAWLLRFPSGLQAGGSSAEHEVLATYWTAAGTAPFALCRDGLLLNPQAEVRYIPYEEIEDAGYYNFEMVKRAKAATRSAGCAPLTIRLESGETIDLRVEVRDDGMPDLLTIAHLIHRRAFVARVQREKRTGRAAG